MKIKIIIGKKIIIYHIIILKMRIQKNKLGFALKKNKKHFYINRAANKIGYYSIIL